MATDAAGFGSTDRIDTLDLIRGVAVMGILSVNIVDFGSPQAQYTNPVALGRTDPASMWVWLLNYVFVDGKFYTLFSMMFGASLLLVTERADASGRGGWSVHWRRMAALFVIGTLHAILLWRGDILVAYAVAGLVATKLRHRSDKVLKRWAIGLLSLMVALMVLTFFGQTHLLSKVEDGTATPQMLEQAKAVQGQFLPSAEKIAKDIAVNTGPYLARIAELARHYLNELAASLFLLPITVGNMAVGMLAYRRGLFTGAWDDARLKRLAAWTIPLGMIAHLLLALVLWRLDFPGPMLMTGLHGAMLPFQIAQALGYAALAVLLARGWGPISRRVAAAGRAAFSNYLGTSVLMVLLFNVAGFYGQWPRWQMWLVVPLVWALMLLWSKPWLERYRYGPAEWLWRSLANLKPQPMRR